jgi:hypothetical protein
MLSITRIFFLLSLLALLMTGVGVIEDAAAQRIVVDDFESYAVGTTPHKWKQPHKKSRSLLDISPTVERDDDYFEVVSEGGSKRARFYTRNESTQLAKQNGDGYTWNLRTHPRMSWDWMAKQIPEGAREDKDDLNDSGAAIYVTFDTDWLGRPRSIKYTYSSTLPEGETAKHGPLRVIVVSSATKGLGQWKHIERDVVADYRRVFGGDPPNEPISITLWSDTDNTQKISEVYFDNITLHPAR